MKRKRRRKETKKHEPDIGFRFYFSIHSRHKTIKQAKYYCRISNTCYNAFGLNKPGADSVICERGRDFASSSTQAIT
jgi:hypothetical protein